MAYNDDSNKNGFDRQMYDVDEKCSQCSAPITKLPFKPDGVRPLFCQECYRNNKKPGRGSR